MTGATGTEASVEFQSTLPVRGATFRPSQWWQKCSIFQSTLPVRGATAAASAADAADNDFNPRSP